MKKNLLLLLLSVIGLTGWSQTGSWKVKLNNKLILAASKEDETMNCKKVKPSDWKKNGSLQLTFIEDNKDTWRRTFLFYDEADNEILTRDSTTKVILPLSQLHKLYTGKKEIRIYTIVSPLDPSIAIRMRRVHLCTLKLP